MVPAMLPWGRCSDAALKGYLSFDKSDRYLFYLLQALLHPPTPWSLGWPLFNFFFQSFAPLIFSDAFWYSEFEYPISFLNFGKKCRSKPFESQFWPILTVFVMLCGVQSPRWSSYLIRTKYYFFASFWRINRLFYQIICAQWRLVFGDFHRQCTADRPFAAGVQNSSEVVLDYWSKNSKLVWARVRSCRLESCHLDDSPRQEYGNDDMPIISKALLSWDIKTWHGSGWQDQMHGSLCERPREALSSWSQPLQGTHNFGYF